MRIAIIIPAYNEEIAVGPTVRDFHAACPEALLCVVDNNSTDRTAAAAREAFAALPGCRSLLLAEPMQGKSFAVRRAFLECEADLYVLVDADHTYAAADLPLLLRPVAAGEVDMAVGERKGGSGPDPARSLPLHRRPFHDFGNRMVRTLINRLFRARLRDVFSGYRVFSRRFVKNLPILCTGFELETEVTLHALDCRLRFVEIPVSYRDRLPGSVSKLDTFADGWRVCATLFSILRYNKPLFFFGSVAAGFGVAGLGIGAIPVVEFERTGLVLHFPSAILATGLMLCAGLNLAIGLILDMVARVNRQRFELRLLESAPGAPR